MAGGDISIDVGFFIISEYHFGEHPYHLLNFREKWL
jgi:hypothetical protein